MAKLISATSTSLHDAGQHLRSGNLVSFPTETVYGLGCHALDPIAVQKVFDAKERPLSDPLIVHVCESDDALKLWDASSSTTNDDTTNPPPPVVPWESEYISCIYGNDYPQEYHIHIPMRELMLFDSKDECCTVYARIEACRPTQGPTSLLTQPLSNNSGAAFSYHGWFCCVPLVVGCVVSILLSIGN